MHCLYIILHASIFGLIIFLKPRLKPRLWAFSCCKPSPSPIQAHRWAGPGWAQMGWAWVGFGLWARPSTSLWTTTFGTLVPLGPQTLTHDISFICLTDSLSSILVPHSLSLFHSAFSLLFFTGSISSLRWLTQTKQAAVAVTWDQTVLQRVKEVHRLTRGA